MFGIVRSKPVSSCAWLAGILLTGTLLAQAPSVSIPPEPPPPPAPARPSRQGLSPEEFKAKQEAYVKAFAAWRLDSAAWQTKHDAWQASLTVEQWDETQRQKREPRQAQPARFAAAQRLPEPGDGYAWESAAARMRLTPDVVAALRRDGVAAAEPVRQIFVSYVGGPIFVTSDSILAAFHELFETSFRELELTRVQSLRGALEQLMTATHELSRQHLFSPDRFEAAWRYAQEVVGPALVLVGTPLDQFDAGVRFAIAEQVAAIRRAQGIALPDWLAPATDDFVALDYGRFKPVGFYDTDPRLADYFRAVRWLQMVPLRADRAHEFAAAVLLSTAMEDSQLSGYFTNFNCVVGPTDDPGLVDLREALPRAYPRSAYASGLSGPMLPLQISEAMVSRGFFKIDADLRRRTRMAGVIDQVSFRVLPAARLPDAVLFQTLNNRGAAPTGLAVAAWLGSSFAESRLTGRQTAALNEFRRTAASEPVVRRRRAPEMQFYPLYLDALRQLFSPPPAAAPAFMASPAWAAKSCETALGGWSEVRHTFTLHAKLSVVTLGVYEQVPGFVEPNPDFYGALAAAVGCARDYFAANGIFERAVSSGAKLKIGELSLPDRWQALERMAFILQGLAGRQLRGESWSPDAVRFLKSYGDQLAEIMGYTTVSAEHPGDDAPAWVEVNRDPSSGQSLAAALGRPRTFYVLYPWRGMEILCRGAICTYYEYASHDRLTDAEWKALLDSDHAPARPSWAP